MGEERRRRVRKRRRERAGREERPDSFLKWSGGGSYIQKWWWWLGGGVSHKRCLLHAVRLTRQPIPRALYFSSKLFSPLLSVSLFSSPWVFHLHLFPPFLRPAHSLRRMFSLPCMYFQSLRQELWVNCWSRDKPGQSLSFNTHYPPFFSPSLLCFIICLSPLSPY